MEIQHDPCWDSDASLLYDGFYPVEQKVTVFVANVAGEPVTILPNVRVAKVIPLRFSDQITISQDLLSDILNVGLNQVTLEISLERNSVHEVESKLTKTAEVTPSSRSLFSRTKQNIFYLKG